MINLLLGLGIIILGGLGFCVFFVYQEISRENLYRHQFGSIWPEEYEKVFGLLTEARGKIILCVIGMIAITSITIWLGRLLTTKHSNQTQRRRHHHHQPHESSVARNVRYRRNMILSFYFGFPGILLSILLVIFRWGIFNDHENEATLGLFLFVGSYIALVSGCWWWLKAKGWTEAIVFMPLALMFVPFVRVLFIISGFLPITMVMAPLTLIVVVFALPDRSGVGRHRANGKSFRRTQIKEKPAKM
jgi:hypothetical protein